VAVDVEKLNALEWRNIGPHRGGRVVAVAAGPKEPMTFYFGACAGGVWKSTDAAVAIHVRLPKDGQGQTANLVSAIA
jgi:hypothetical protein